MQQIPLYDQVVAERSYAVGDQSTTGRRLVGDCRTVVFRGRRQDFMFFSSLRPLVSATSIGDYHKLGLCRRLTSRRPVPTEL